MPDLNTGVLLEEYPPAITTGTLSLEAILSYFMEQMQLQPKEQEPCKARERTPVTDPTSDESLFMATTEPAWLIKAKYDLDRIMALPENWDSYGSPSIPEVLYKNAENFLRSLEVEDIEPPFVAPVSGGGIQFEWQNKARELEIEFVQSNVFGYLKIIGDEPIDEGQFSVQDYNSARLLIKWFKTGQP